MLFFIISCNNSNLVKDPNRKVTPLEKVAETVPEVYFSNIDTAGKNVEMNKKEIFKSDFFDELMSQLSPNFNILEKSYEIGQNIVVELEGAHDMKLYQKFIIEKSILAKLRNVTVVKFLVTKEFLEYITREHLKELLKDEDISISEMIYLDKLEINSRSMAVITPEGKQGFLVLTDQDRKIAKEKKKRIINILQQLNHIHVVSKSYIEDNSELTDRINKSFFITYFIPKAERIEK